MGLDVIIDVLSTDEELHPVLQDCLSHAGLPPYRPVKKEFDPPEFRAHILHDLAKYCRQEKLPFFQIRRLTCSLYQMIAPIDFIEAIPEFADKSPQDYKLTEYDPRDDSRWPYYLGTPASDVYLLSAQQLSRECIDFLDLLAPNWSDEHFDWNAKDLHEQAINAACLLKCCEAAIEGNAVIEFG